MTLSQIHFVIAYCVCSVLAGAIFFFGERTWGRHRDRTDAGQLFVCSIVFSPVFLALGLIILCEWLFTRSADALNKRRVFTRIGEWVHGDHKQEPR